LKNNEHSPVAQKLRVQDWSRVSTRSSHVLRLQRHDSTGHVDKDTVLGTPHVPSQVRHTKVTFEVVTSLIQDYTRAAECALAVKVLYESR